MAAHRITLENPKHEHFCILVAKGVIPAEAARTVGYSQSRAKVTASELSAKPEIKKRNNELLRQGAERAAEKIGVDKAWVMRELVEIVKLGKESSAILDQEGNPTGAFKPPTNLPAANRALELIGKELAMFVDRSEVRTGPLDGVDHDEIKQIGDAIGALLASGTVVAEGASSTRH